MDTTIFRALNAFYPDFPALWDGVGTGAGTAVFVLLVAIAAVATGRGRWLLPALVAVILSDATAVRVIKPMIGRERPCATLDKVRGGVPCGAGEAMPSAHAANTMAAAAVVGSPTLAVFSLGVGAARVVDGQHWPSDVAAGWALGLVVGGLVRSVCFKVFKWV